MNRRILRWHGNLMVLLLLLRVARMRTPTNAIVL
jgi:hypothetical protein